ncbi:MAG: rhomboid family intramembrane serine protease [Saprospiraceae bacterium]
MKDILERTTPTVKVLLAINVLMFVLTWIMPQMSDVLALHYYESPLFKPFQLVSHFFMHGGLGHIAFNMYALVMFGAVVERMIGAQKFLTLYVLSAVGAFALHMLVVNYQVSGFSSEVLAEVSTQGAEILANGQNYTDEFLGKANLKFNGAMLGASGAIMGILAAFGVMYPNAKLGVIFLPFSLEAKYFIPILIVVEIFLGVKEFSWDNIAHFAHIGGAIVGFGLMMMWKKRDVRSGM